MLAQDQLAGSPTALQSFHKAFAAGIVMGCAGRLITGNHRVNPKHPHVVLANVLHSAVRMVNQSGRRLSVEDRLFRPNHFDHDLYTSYQARERTLNAAIVQANISESFEEFFDAFYADDIEASTENGEEPIRGEAKVRSPLANFLVPLHAMAEVGGLLVSIRQSAIPGDAADESHSAWTLNLVGVSGRTCTLSWCVLRKWNWSGVVYEHHYDHQQSGGPLTSDDLIIVSMQSRPLQGFEGPHNGFQPNPDRANPFSPWGSVAPRFPMSGFAEQGRSGAAPLLP